MLQSWLLLDFKFPEPDFDICSCKLGEANWAAEAERFIRLSR